jgi:hypothetical protein
MYTLMFTILFGANATSSLSVPNIQTLALCEEAGAAHTARIKKTAHFVTITHTCAKTSEK